MADFTCQYIAGDNLPEITIKHTRDMTDFISHVQATAYKGFRLVSSALTADLVFKVSPELADLLAKEGIPTAGIRAYLPGLGNTEWVLITAISGINATVTRAQDDPDGNPTVAKDVPNGSVINIVPLDSVPLSTALDPLDTTNKTVIHTLTSAQTNILPSTYTLDIHYADMAGVSARKFTKCGVMTIVSDANAYGAA